MIIEEVKGDLLTLFKEGKFDAIAHGANCHHLMGAGIAKQIKDQFPESYYADLTSLKNVHKLGDFTRCKTEFGDIYNLYTQFEPGANFEYSALIECMKKLDYVQHHLLEKIKLGLPQIGSGIGGGDWNIIKEILGNTSSNLQITIVYYDKGEVNMGQTAIDFKS